MFEKKKKKTTTNFVTFFDGFVTKKGNDSCCHLLRWFVGKKVMATMLSPFSMVVVL
jgi:hypothetical protein